MSDADWIACMVGLLLQQSHKSLRDVAAYCSVSPSAVWNWSQGKAVPSAVSLVRMARLFDVSLDVFDRQSTGE